MNADGRESKSALLVIDVQKDFLPGGALAVPDGDAVIPVIDRMIAGGDFDFVVATRDWHPENHGSFAANHPGKEPGDRIRLNGLEQILWPIHCVRETPGAESAPGLDAGKFDAVFPKGTDPTIDSYSGFHDNGHRKSTGLGDWLRERGVRTVTIAGLATDYCVKFTALDAVNEGLETSVRTDACRGVELNPGDVESALEAMREQGVRVVEITPDQVEVETLYRPAGEEERRLVEVSDFSRWPPRLPEQPIFYPVTNRKYATEIARRWNTADPSSGHVGYVTRFRVKAAYLAGFERQKVGAGHHTEYWIPAESLDEFNAHLVGKIEVLETFKTNPVQP